MATVPNITTQTVGGTGTAAWANSVKDGVDFLVGTGANVSPVVVLKQTVAQNIATSNWTGVEFTSEDLDSDGMHSTTTNPSRLTAVTAGWYQMSGSVSFDAVSTTGQRAIGFRVNGVAGGIPTADSANQNASSSGVTKMGLSTMLYLAVGDYVELVARQNTGGTRATDVSSTEFQPRLSAFWVRSA